ncbi:MAG TPA: carboxypeptidase-like regulatory domain-containing protein [Bryobacteraceae bacterium]|nr:carboxypeptidase-like regulatory domain-containing protein [Bryobacteraceae bacterium]
MTSMKISGSLRAILLVIAGSMAITPSLVGQSAGTGALAGTITDPSGAAIPDVAVTLTNADTGQTRTSTTGANGAYRFALIPPGSYRIRFSAMGFKTAEVSPVTVNVTETPVLDRALEIGVQSEQISVEGQAETLQTATSTLGTTVSSQTVTALPLSSRNYTQIMALSAGTNTGANNATALGKGTQNMSVNGNDPGQNNFQMDGVNITNFANAGNANDGGLYAGVGIPSPDSLQEFKVQTSTYDASYGRNPGGNVNVLTRSGTNQFHGTAFEFLRDTIFNANDFFYNRNNPASATTKQILNQNQFGGVFGGPIKKDKFFIFGSYQGTREKNGFSSQGLTTALLPPIPAGDRSAPGFQAALGAANCPQNNPGNSLFVTSSGSQNVLCSGSNISPVALNILNIKLANGQYYFPSSGTSGYAQKTFTSPAIYNGDQGLLNFDYVINAKNTLSGRWFFTNDPQIAPLGGQLPGAVSLLGFDNVNSVLKLTTIVTNSIVNEVRVSYQRNLSQTNAQAIPGVTNAQLGITPNVPGINLPPLIAIASGGYSILGGINNGTYSVTNQTQAADQVSFTIGRHTMRAGFEWEQNAWPITWSGSRGNFTVLTFNDLLVGGPQNTTTGQPGNINQCLFCTRSAPQGIVHGYYAAGGSAFFQDDYKATSRLTFNLGMRWEYNGALNDKYGNLSQIWVSRLQANPVPPSAPTSSGAGISQWVVPSNFTSHYGQPPAGVLVSPNLTTERVGARLTNFAPRVGFAFQANSKLVLRGGAGIFYDRVGGDRIVYSVEQGNPYSATLDYNAFNNQTLANPFPTLPVLGTFSSRYANFSPTCQANPAVNFAVCNSNLNIPFLDEVLHTPLIRQYNLGVQYQFAPRWILEVGYVGSSSINLMDMYHNNNTAQLASATNPINGITTNTTANVLYRVPNLGYQAVGVRGTGFDGFSSYNSMQVTVRKQFSRGFTFQGAYTYSKTMSDQYNNVSNSNYAGNLAQQYGPTEYSRPQRFVANYSYDLPFGSHTGAMQKLLGGWNVSGVTVVQGGAPITIADSTAGTLFGTSGASQAGFGRVQLAPGMTYDNIATPGGVEARLGGASGGPGFFNKGAFVAPPAMSPTGTVYYSIPGSSGQAQCAAANPGITCGTLYGNSGPGIILGPGQFNFDISILKTTAIRENHMIQVRAEFFNAFNHPQFSNPNFGQGAIYGLPNFAAGNFGQITSTSVNPRVIQFALKYIF